MLSVQPVLWEISEAFINVSSEQVYTECVPIPYSTLSGLGDPSEIRDSTFLSASPGPLGYEGVGKSVIGPQTLALIPD